jgi:predicted glutamine amidotransferase
MCQLIYTNLHEERLNQKLSLLLAVIGAEKEKHGWGILSGKTGRFVKTGIPANYLSNLGEMLAKQKGDIFSHIRSASFSVPVCDENAHPFVVKGISQFHNGTLTPKDEKGHTMKEFVDEIDEKTGVVSKKEVKRSDSLIFLERLSAVYTEKNENFLDAIQATMLEFTGKFAFMYVLKNAKKMPKYIIRGKTADLYISYLKENKTKEAKTIGYVIDTNKDVLENGINLLLNLEQVEGNNPLYFTEPEEIKKETIFIPEEFGLVEVGELKENIAVTTSLYPTRGNYWGADGQDFTAGGNGIKGMPNFTPTGVEKYVESIYSFMSEYAVSLKEIQIMFFKLYGLSLLEADEVILKHFCNKVIATLRKDATKQLRKKVKALSNGRFPIYLYSKFVFPWMLVPKNIQETIVDALREYKKDT